MPNKDNTPQPETSSRFFDREILQDRCDDLRINPNPANCRRMRRALDYLEKDLVRVDPSHLFAIVSSETRDRAYRVSISDAADISTYECDCPDIRHNAPEACKHQIAVFIEIENLIFDEQAQRDLQFDSDPLSDKYDSEIAQLLGGF